MCLMEENEDILYNSTVYYVYSLINLYLYRDVHLVLLYCSFNIPSY